MSIRSILADLFVHFGERKKKYIFTHISHVPNVVNQPRCLTCKVCFFSFAPELDDISVANE